MARRPTKKPPPSEPTAEEPLPRVSRHIQPVGPRVLIRILKSPDRSESGLFLPQGVKESGASALLGEVIEVARTLPKGENLGTDEELIRNEDDERDDDLPDFGKNVSGIPLGSNVLFEKERGVAVPWDETLRVLDVRHVLALVDIIPEAEIQ